MSYTMKEWQAMSKEERQAAGMGEMPKATKVILSIFGLILLWVAYLIFSPSDKKEVAAKPATHQQVVEAQFSKWDGSHTTLAKYIKENLNDPSSYEHVQTNYWDMQDSIVVKTKIRAKNGFGALITQSYYAVADLKGNIRNVQAE